MPEIKPRFSNLFAFSLFALAGSISYFTYQLSLITIQIPLILESIKLTSEKVEPALHEISEIRALIEPIMVEVKTINQQIPAILNESAQIRSSIPPILNESAALRDQLPTALSAIENASSSVTLISGELNDYQPIATEALAQIDGTRKEIPQILDRTDAMIDKARVAVKDASSGVVTNALGGLIRAPFKLVGNLGSNILDLNKSDIEGFTQEDLDNLQQISSELLDNGKLGDTRKLSNPKTNLRVSISIQKEFVEDDRTCRELLIKSWVKSELKFEKSNVACQNTDGDWEDTAD